MEAVDTEKAQILRLPAADRLSQAKAALGMAENRLGVQTFRNVSNMRSYSQPDGISQLYAKIAQVAGEDGWVAFVGTEQVGWARCAQEGIDLSRVIYVPAPSAAAQVCTALAAGVCALVVDPELLSASQLRNLRARGKIGGCLVFTLGTSRAQGKRKAS